MRGNVWLIQPTISKLLYWYWDNRITIPMPVKSRISWIHTLDPYETTTNCMRSTWTNSWSLGDICGGVGVGGGACLRALVCVHVCVCLWELIRNGLSNDTMVMIWFLYHRIACTISQTSNSKLKTLSFHLLHAFIYFIKFSLYQFLLIINMPTLCNERISRIKQPWHFVMWIH